MAGADGAALLSVIENRSAAVVRVLWQVLALNLIVAVAKIAFGYASGAISVLSDGFHSLTDAASNLVGLIGARAAARPPDPEHPYGHRKFETVAAAAVTIFLVVVFLEVLRNAFSHLVSGSGAAPAIASTGLVIMAATVGINLMVVTYESRAARRLGSELLLADATQTRGDVWTSFTVIGALAGAHLGVPILDPLGALIVSGFIAYAGFQIARATTRILSDRVVISESDIEREVMSVPGVVGCHQIRTRGSVDHVFLDLHVWLPPDMALTDAHHLSHVVKDHIMSRYPQIVDAIIHIEPPPREDRSGPSRSS